MADGLAIRQPRNAHLPPRAGRQAFAHRARIVGGQTIESAERLGARFAEREGARERGAATRTGARYGERQIVEHFPIKRGVKRAAGVLRAQLISTLAGALRMKQRFEQRFFGGREFKCTHICSSQ